jgi:serine protease AprX
VVGGQDTGYQWNHPALINAYRGWNGATADHNYNWHDAIHENNPNTLPGNPCGFDSLVPCDDNGHGTHTMGTMIGDDGGSNQIGMAPGAQWISCRNMEEGWGTPATYTECYQWFIAPTDLNGENPDSTKAPHVINNSWGCPVSEGCVTPDILLAVVQNVRAAGILTAHSAGNSGSSCSTVNTPAAIYDESFTVGSTTSTDAISSFSSRGPVTIDGSGRLKPDITAPGSSIRSSRPTNTYGISSGTSMAGPHVAGLVALLISANPALAGQVDALEQIITSTAVPLTTTQNCGDVPGDQIPNNTFGWGRIDALAAVEYVLAQHDLLLSGSTAAMDIYPGQELTYSFELTHTTPTSRRATST